MSVASSDHIVTHVMIDKPDWLDLNDAAAPAVVQLTLDGQPIEPAKAGDLGWIEPPKQAVISLRDAQNPLSKTSLGVSLNGQPINESDAVQTTFGDKGDSVTITVDLALATAADHEQPRRHRVSSQQHGEQNPEQRRCKTENRNL